ncbi:2-phosphosulfolactate phosphatase [bacterium]|nr:2-phosphosulfolactate phosphatase [bacterium]
MNRPVYDVALLPSLVSPESLTGQTVIVVDVLRATTTIVSALYNGCTEVMPQPSVEAARMAYQQFQGDAVIGGERGGQIVEGFHQGNSPIEYTPTTIKDKTLILATTNGTVAMEHCRAANRVLIGAMVNLDAVAQQIKEDSQVTVVCSGTDRCITSEDVLFAGALLERIIAIRIEANQPAGQLTDMASIALGHWKTTRRELDQGKPLADFFRNARGGLNLVKIGHDPDIVFASQIDTFNLVPELDLERWTIRDPRPKN